MADTKKQKQKKSNKMTIRNSVAIVTNGKKDKRVVGGERVQEGII
jgi:hypothetical protein